MNDISTKLTENFVQDEMKYIQRLEKAWLMPIFPWFNPKRKIYTFNNKPGAAFVPTWFYWEYRDLFPKIDEFNLRIENVLRKYKCFFSVAI